MKKLACFFLLLMVFMSACSPARTIATPAPTPTIQASPSPTATLRPTPSPTSTPRPIGVDEIAQLGSPPEKSVVVASPDEKTYTITDETGVHLYDSASKKEIYFFPVEFGSVQYSPNSQMIVVEGIKTAQLIRVRDSKILGEFKIGYMFFHNAFSPDGKRFAYIVDCSWFYEPECKETIHMWDIATQQDVFEIKAQSVIAIFEFLELTFDPTGAFLLASGSKGVIHVWDALTGKPAFSLQNPTGSLSVIAFSHDGKYLASFDESYNNVYILLWNWDTKERRTVTGKYDGLHTSVSSMTFSADDTQINLIFNDDTTMIWDLTSGKLSQGEKFINQEAIRQQQMRERGEYIAPPESIAYSPDGQTLAVGSYSFSPIVLWDLRTNKVRATLDGKVSHLKYTHRGNRLIVLKAVRENMTEEDTDISIWDTEHNVKLHTFKVPWAGTFDISPDDSTLAIDSFHAIQLWDIEKGTLIQSLATPGLLESPYYVSYSADGKSISTVLLKALGQREYELSIRSWDAITGTTLTLPFQPVHLGNSDGPVELQHDTLALFQYLPDTTIVLWDIKTGKKVQSIAIDAYHSPGLIFSPNEQVMVLHYARKFEFYDVQTGFQIYHQDDNGLADPWAFNKDGNQLALSGDGIIDLWDISRILAAAHPQP